MILFTEFQNQTLKASDEHGSSEKSKHLAHQSSLSPARLNASEQGQQALQQFVWVGRAAGNVEIHGHDGVDPADDCVASRKTTAIPSAIADGHNPFWFGHRVKGALKRLGHVSGDGSGDHQDIGVAR